MQRFKAMALAVISVLALTALVGVGSASAALKSIDSGTSLKFTIFDAPHTASTECHSGDMKVVSKPTIPGRNGDPLDTTFSGCTSTASNFPTTVDMKGCYFSLNETYFYSPYNEPKPLLYTDCSSGGQITFTVYLKPGGQKLCTTTLFNTYSGGIVATEEETASGFNWYADSQAWPNNDPDYGRATEYNYYTEGPYCPEDGSLSGGVLDITLAFEYV